MALLREHWKLEDEAQEDGYQAVAFKVGQSLEAALKENARLKQDLENMRDLAYNRAPKIAAEECNRQKAELEARLAEAEARGVGLWAEIDSHRAHVKHLEDSRDVYEKRAEQAEARAKALRAALEEIAEGRFYCADGDCRAIETAQAALRPEQPAESEGKSETKE